MGYYCTVPQCTSLAGKTKNVKFHRFPRDVTMADKWNVILKRGKPYTKYSKVCSLHFTQQDYNVTTMGQWKTLSKDAVPSQNLPKLNPDGSVMVIRKSRTVKYREGRKDSVGDKSDKWVLPLTHTPAPISLASDSGHISDPHESNIAYRLQTLSAIASNLPPQPPLQTPQPIIPPHLKPKKQDAFMQTDPVQSEEDDTQPNNSYSETSDTSFNSEQLDYQTPFKDPKEYVKSYEQEKKFDTPKDYTKTEDYIPQTNEEYNKEAEKYALERKSHNTYEKMETNYQKPVSNEQYNKEAEKYALERKSHMETYQKTVPLENGYQKALPLENGYQKMADIYSFSENKDYQNRNEYLGFNGYQDSVEMLRNQQHNLQMLQEQHRVTENQNFFNDNPIKQEVDISEEEKFLYERKKDQLDANSMYEHRGLIQQQRLLEHLQHQVKQEPDVSGCDSVMQPQGSPYYIANGHTNAAGYYEPVSRPGPELLIAKQNALAAHTQLWQHPTKRPFFYSEGPHYTGAHLLHRYTEDMTRILQ